MRTESRPHPDVPPVAEERDFQAVLGHVIAFVLRSAARHKLLFLACFLIVMSATTVLLRIMPRQYQVDATILAVRNPIMGTFANPTINREWDIPLRAAREVVMRRENLVALCKQTNFVQRRLATRSPIGNARSRILALLGRRPPNEDELLQGIVDGIENDLLVFVGQEGTVTISFVSSDPQLAYDFVEAAIQSFLDARHNVEINTVRETIGILEAQDTRVQKSATEIANRLEQEVRTLRAKSGGARRPAVRAVTPDLPTTSEDDRRLQATIAMKERSLTELEDAQRRRIQELQLTLGEQLNVYASEHPRILETRKDLEAASAPLPEILTLRAEIASLEAEAKRRGVEHSPAPPLLRMDPDLSSLSFDPILADDPRLEYDRSQLTDMLRQHSYLLDRIAAAQVEIDTAEAAFKYRYSVIHPPQLPTGPIRKRLFKVAIAGLLGAIAFAFFTCAALDFHRGTVLEDWQVEQLGIRVLMKVRR